MRIDRVKTTKYNIVYGVISQLVTLVLPFIVQTITIYVLGIEYVGIKGLFGSILSVFSLAELGVGTAITYSMYKPIAEDDIKTIGALLNLYRKLYRYIGMIILLMGILVTPFIKYLIKGDYPSDINIYWVFWLYLAGTVASYWLFAYKSSLLSAYQRRDVVSNIATITNILMGISQIVVLLCTRNYYLYLVLAIIFTVITNLVTSVTVDYMYPEIETAGEVENDLLQDIKKKVGALVIGRICVITRNSFDMIFISAFVGLKTAAIYSNYYYIISIVAGFFFVFLDSIRAGIGNTVELDSIEKNHEDFKFFNFIYMTAVGCASIYMLCLYQPFMKIWVGQELMFADSIMILFPIYFYASRMGNITYTYIEATGKFWELRFCYLMEIVANVFLNFFFAKILGVVGVLLATLITIFIMDFMWQSAILYKAYFKIKQYAFWVNQLKYLGINWGIAFLTWKSISYIVCSNLILELLLKVFASSLVMVILFLIVYRNNGYLADFKSVIKQTVGKSEVSE